MTCLAVGRSSCHCCCNLLVSLFGLGWWANSGTGGNLSSYCPAPGAQPVTRPWGVYTVINPYQLIKWCCPPIALLLEEEIEIPRQAIVNALFDFSFKVHSANILLGILHVLGKLLDFNNIDVKVSLTSECFLC